jgi:hypothetical protein
VEPERVRISDAATFATYSVTIRSEQ